MIQAGPGDRRCDERKGPAMAPAAAAVWSTSSTTTVKSSTSIGACLLACGTGRQETKARGNSKVMATDSAVPCWDGGTSPRTGGNRRRQGTSAWNGTFDGRQASPNPSGSATPGWSYAGSARMGCEPHSSPSAVALQGPWAGKGSHGIGNSSQIRGRCGSDLSEFALLRITFDRLKEGRGWDGAWSNQRAAIDYRRAFVRRGIVSASVLAMTR